MCNVQDIGLFDVSDVGCMFYFEECCCCFIFFFCGKKGVCSVPTDSSSFSSFFLFFFFFQLCNTMLARRELVSFYLTEKERAMRRCKNRDSDTDS